MHKNVEILIGRLVTDPGLRRRFAEEPVHLLTELGLMGLELTPVEIDALAATDAEALEAFAAALDRRLRKAPSAAAINQTISSSTNQNKETQQ